MFNLNKNLVYEFDLRNTFQFSSVHRQVVPNCLGELLDFEFFVLGVEKSTLICL